MKKKYKIKNVGIKKFTVRKFWDFKMIDSKVIVTKVKEFQVIYVFLVEGIILYNTFVDHIKYFFDTHVTFDVC